MPNTHKKTVLMPFSFSFYKTVLQLTQGFTLSLVDKCYCLDSSCHLAKVKGIKILLLTKQKVSLH